MDFIFKRLIQKIIFIITILVLPFYCIGLYNKITEPNTKNLPTEDYLIAGLLLIAMLISDVYLIQAFSKNRKK
jgi:hypothetical protein